MIYEIIGLACLGAMLQNFKYWKLFLETFKIDFAPFNCTLCWTFWITVGANLMAYGPKGIYISCIEAVLAELIDRKLNDF